MAQLDLRCPICGHVDMVQKVSIIAENDVIQREGIYGTNTEPSPLAASLAHPEKPTRRSSAGCGLVIGILLVLFGGVGFVCADNPAERPFLLHILVLGLPILIIGISVDDKHKKEYQHLLAQWPKAEARWNQLYYCRRDDVLFNPFDREAGPVPVSNMRQYLFSDSN